MPIPTTDEMMLPVLRYIDDGQEYRRLSIINMITEHFSLTEDQRRSLSDGGQMEVSLSRKGFIERSRVGYYRITDSGLEFLNRNSEETPTHDRNTEIRIDPHITNSEVHEHTPTPEKLIEDNYPKIKEKLMEELLQQVKNNSPTFFEKLVIDLLFKMGYGGSREDAQAVGRSGDGGIDGIIKADPLGLNVVYVQAKRWEGNVGAPPVRDFVGALDGEGVQEGIFITTSDFNPAAKEFAERSSKRVILINGSELARYMIEHNVGVSTTKTYEIKRVDSDYFAENAENS